MCVKLRNGLGQHTGPVQASVEAKLGHVICVTSLPVTSLVANLNYGGNRSYVAGFTMVFVG